MKGNTNPSIQPITLQINQIVKATGAITTRPVRKEFLNPARRPDGCLIRFSGPSN